MLDAAYDGRDEKGEDKGSSDDVARQRRLFRAFEENKEREQREQKESRRYYSARQWTDAELNVLKQRNQPAITDNIIGRKVDALVGLEQRMRRDPKAYGRNPQDQQSADVATACLRFVCDKERWDHVASDATHDGMVTGIGVAWIGIENRQGTLEVVIKPGQVDRFFYDPRTTRSDFSDARYMGMHLWVDIDDLIAEFPDRKAELDDLIDRDGGFSLLALEEDRDEQWGDFEHRRVRLVEMYERKFLPNQQGFGWYYCKFTGHLKLDSRWSPYIDERGVPDCPYVAWSPYIDERGDRYGIVRNMRPLQDEVNQRRSKYLHMLNVRRVHVRKGAHDDINELQKQLAKPDGIIEHDGEWGSTIGIVDTTFEARGHADLLMEAKRSLEGIGPNPGVMGKGDQMADSSGRALLAQRDAGMTELSPVFDRLRDWKLRCYRAMWNRVKQAWTGERYIRVTDNPKAPEFIGVNQYSMDQMSGQISGQNLIGTLDVDIILDEGPDTVVMQEELMQTMTQLGEAAMGPLGRILIELSQVSNKERLLQLLDEANAPKPEQVELQKRVAMLEEQMQRADIAKKYAETENKRADTLAKLQQAMVPPEAVEQIFPMAFSDQLPPESVVDPMMAQGGPEMQQPPIPEEFMGGMQPDMGSMPPVQQFQ